MNVYSFPVAKIDAESILLLVYCVLGESKTVNNSFSYNKLLVIFIKSII